MLTLIICPPRRAKFRRHVKEVTSVSTSRMTLHQSNTFLDLVLLVSGFAVVFKMNAENRNKP